MALVACTACDRRHVRPVNSKCLYFKFALDKCAALGASRDNWKFYLPDIGTLDGGEGEVDGARKSPVSKELFSNGEFKDIQLSPQDM